MLNFILEKFKDFLTEFTIKLKDLILKSRTVSHKLRQMKREKGNYY